MTPLLSIRGLRTWFCTESGVARAVDGVDLDNPGTALDRSGHPNPVPRIVGKIRRRHAVEVPDLLFLKKNTDRKVKITLPGPFTMLQQAQNEFYPSEEAAAMDYAAALNEESAMCLSKPSRS